MDESWRAAAETLLGAGLVAVRPVAGGGNSRVFAVEDVSGNRFALKIYPPASPVVGPPSEPARGAPPVPSAAAGRDRLGAEFAAASFLHRHGVTETPRAIAADPARRIALYEWIEGEPVGEATAADLAAALAFVRRLAGLATTPDAAALPAAAEACPAAGDLLGQLTARRVRLGAAATDDPTLATFLERGFDPLLARAEARARAGYARRGWVWEQPLPRDRLCLSPSDFGFHNALRRPDGSLVFLDFEYFGWDDPVRLAADFPQHPGMNLRPAQGRAYLDGLRGIFAADPGFASRLDLLFPLVGLRWCLILLNEFLPERWRARCFARAGEDWEQARRRQMAKARDRLAAVSLFLEEHA